MAKIIDPDDLIVSSSAGNLGVDGNIWLDVSSKTFDLAPYGSLVAKDGVTGNALWAKFIDLWTTATYQPYPFPMNVLDARSGQYIFGQDPGGTYNGWKPNDDVCRQMIRDAGWSEYSVAGVLNRQYVGMVALASGFPSGAQFYYQRASGGSAYNFTYDDAPNEAIQVYGDASNGNFDNRTYFKLFCREESYLYDDAILTDVGETSTGAFKVALPIAVGADLDITNTDANVATISPYTEINIKYFSGSFTRTIESATGRNFGIVIDVGTHSGIDGSAPGAGSILTSATGGMTVGAYNGGVLTIYEGTDAGVSFPIVSNTATTITVTGTISSGSNLSFTCQRATPVTATLKEIYTKIQYQLRQTGNINAVSGGTSVIGTTASLLLNFVGPSLKCGYYIPTNPAGGGSGVLIQGIQDADLNSIVFYDNSAATREYPYASAGTLNFNAALTSGGTGYYRMYFTNDDAGSNLGYDYGTGNAITVNDKDGNPIVGTITAGSISFTYDYTNNDQRGAGSEGEDAPVTVIAGNAGSAKPVVATGVISQSKGIIITLTAETDRAYIV
jgi:hypothetical protein